MKAENFSPEPGKMDVLHYKVHINTPLRYFVWPRAHSTGPEDNGLHVGLDGQWPTSGQCLQWCVGKKHWRWESKQRTKKEHCGKPFKIFLDIQEAGEQIIQFSMLEDGFEFDKWLMTNDLKFHRSEGLGPVPVARQGTLPAAFPFVTPSEPPSQQNTAILGNVQALKMPATRSQSSMPKTSPTQPLSNEQLQPPRQPNGDGNVDVSGELKQWHKVTLNLNGPYAHEKDNDPNPFRRNKPCHSRVLRRRRKRGEYVCRLRDHLACPFCA